MTVRFEWDPEKARANERKHGVAFSDAMHVFADPHALFLQDRIDESGQLRWHAIGAAAGIAILVVVHTVPTPSIGETVRIISARPATRKERSRYEENCEEDFGR